MLTILGAKIALYGSALIGILVFGHPAVSL